VGVGGPGSRLSGSAPAYVSVILSEADVILSEAKEPEPGFGSFASLRMTTPSHVRSPSTCRHHHPAVFFAAGFPSFSTSIAAFRPFTPITLPPGCVPAPQSSTPFIGVRALSRRSHMY